MTTTATPTKNPMTIEPISVEEINYVFSQFQQFVSESDGHMHDDNCPDCQTKQALYDSSFMNLVGLNLFTEFVNNSVGKSHNEMGQLLKSLIAESISIGFTFGLRLRENNGQSTCKIN